MIECRDCEYWNQVDVAQGKCLRNPPHVFIVPAQVMGTGMMGMQTITAFPITKSDEGCGQGTVKYEATSEGDTQ